MSDKQEIKSLIRKALLEKAKEENDSEHKLLIFDIHEDYSMLIDDIQFKVVALRADQSMYLNTDIDLEDIGLQEPNKVVFEITIPNMSKTYWLFNINLNSYAEEEFGYMDIIKFYQVKPKERTISLWEKI